jgi:hypothetical protein
MIDGLVLNFEKAARLSPLFKEPSGENEMAPGEPIKTWSRGKETPATRSKVLIFRRSLHYKRAE